MFTSHYSETADMETTLSIVSADQTAGEIALYRNAERANEYAAASKSAATVRAYSTDWQAFTAWCSERGLVSLPADPRTVALYLADQAATCKPATLGRRMAAIAKAHQSAGYESPASMKHAAVADVWHGIRRTHGVAQDAKAPAVVEDVRRMVAVAMAGSNVMLAARDRALLLIGFAGAFRRSELVALNLEDILQTGDGLVITLRRSKTDQEGAGRKVGIPYGSTPETCPVRAYVAWLAAAQITSGPVFRNVNRHGQVQPAALTDQSVALVVKRYAAEAGLDAKQYAGHSLRAGLATTAAAAGVSERAIMAQTGHKSAAMVRRYIRDGALFRENAAARIGL
jgi:site-specific recombinase XerD